MKERAYINPDGSVKAEIIAEQQASLAMSAQRHNVDPKLVDALMEEVNKHGYVIIPNLVSRELMNNIKAEITPLLTHDGRNEFEGHKTRRIYSVIEKTLALLDRVLLPNYLLSQLQAINILPGETSQPLHCDVYRDFFNFRKAGRRNRNPIHSGNGSPWRLLVPCSNDGASHRIGATFQGDHDLLGDGRISGNALERTSLV